MIGRKSENTVLSEEKKEFCREGVDLFLTWIGVPGHDIFSQSTSFFSGLQDRNKIENKKYVRKCITDSFFKQDVKDAALIFFNFVDRLYSLSDAAKAPEFFDALVDAIGDERLTLKYANNLYRACRGATRFTHESNSDRYAFSKWLAPDLKTSAWINTVEKLQTIALDKLEIECNKLDSSDQIRFLNEAKKMVIFNELLSNYRITAGFSQSKALVHIDLLIDKLKQAFAEQVVPILKLSS